MVASRNAHREIRLVLDAMGGDLAPAEMVAGAAVAREELGLTVILAGDPEAIGEEVRQRGLDPFEVVEAREVVGMADKGAWSVKERPDSSLMRGAEYVKGGGADALVSAGNTGAVMASAFVSWGRIRGIKRPAVAAVLPPLSAPKILIDAGANADCRPEFLAQFARMGSVYHRLLTGKEEPAVGLLNIGSEEGKGNELARAAHEILRQDTSIRFAGNMEGRDIASPNFDVIVTDGFTGNVALKTIEGTAAFITSLLAQSLGRLDREKLLPVLPALNEVRQQLDYEETGGALLLGVRGVCVIAHGSSRARAIRNALKVAADAVREGLVERIEEFARGG